MGLGRISASILLVALALLTTFHPHAVSAQSGNTQTLPPPTQGDASFIISDLWTDINDDVSLFDRNQAPHDHSRQSILQRFIQVRLQEHRSSLARLMSLVQESDDVVRHRNSACQSYVEFLRAERVHQPDGPDAAELHQQTMHAACLGGARCMLQHKQYANARAMYKAAQEWAPYRAEGFYEEADLLIRNSEEYDAALSSALTASMKPLPTSDQELLLDTEVYTYRALDLVGVVAYYLDEIELGKAALDLAIKRFEESGYSDVTGGRATELMRLRTNIERYTQSERDYIPARIAANAYKFPLPDDHPLIHLIYVIGVPGETADMVEASIKSACDIIDGYALVDIGASSDVKDRALQSLEECELKGTVSEVPATQEEPILTVARDTAISQLESNRQLVFALSLETGETVTGDAAGVRSFLYRHVYRGSPANRAYYIHMTEDYNGHKIVSHKRRIFRLDCNLRMDPLSHEVLVSGLAPDSDLTGLPDVPMAITKIPLAQRSPALDERWITDLNLLRAQYPQDPSTAYALAQAYILSGRRRDAAIATDAFLELSGQEAHEAYAAHMFKANRAKACAKGQGDDDSDDSDMQACAQQCIEQCHAALQAEGDRAEPYYLQSQCFEVLNDTVSAHTAATQAHAMKMPSRANSLFLQPDVYDSFADMLYQRHMKLERAGEDLCSISARLGVMDALGHFSSPRHTINVTRRCIDHLVEDNPTSPALGRHYLHLATALDNMKRNDEAAFVFTATAELDLLIAPRPSGDEATLTVVPQVKNTSAPHAIIYARIPATTLPAWDPLHPAGGSEFADLVALAQSLARHRGYEVDVYYDAHLAEDGTPSGDAIVDPAGVRWHHYSLFPYHRSAAIHVQDGDTPFRCDTFISWRAPESAILGSHCLSRFVWYIDDIEAPSRFLSPVIQGIVSKTFVPSIASAAHLPSGFRNIVVGGVGYRHADVAPVALDTDKERDGLRCVTDASMGDVHLLLQMWTQVVQQTPDAHLDVIVPPGFEADDSMQAILDQTPGLTVHVNASTKMTAMVYAQASWFFYVGDGMEARAVSSTLFAMASGLLPVTAQRGATAEVTRGYDYGIGRPEGTEASSGITPANDEEWYTGMVEAFVNATSGKFAMRPYRARMQANIHSLYEWDNVVTGFTQYFHDALRDTHGGFVVAPDDATIFCRDVDTCPAATYMAQLQALSGVARQAVDERVRILTQAVDHTALTGLLQEESAAITDAATPPSIVYKEQS